MGLNDVHNRQMLHWLQSQTNYSITLVNSTKL